MAVTGMDRFLNNVLKRSYKDVMVNPWILFCIFPGCLSFLFIVAWSIAQDWGMPVASLISPKIVLIVACFVAIMFLMVIYLMARALISHCSRDMDWMLALLGFAAYHGKDTSELEELCDSMSGVAKKRYEYVALAAFILFVAILTVLNLSVDIADLSDDDSNIMTILIIIYVLATMAVMNIHNIAVVYLVDRTQSRFTEVFSDLMSTEEEKLDTMSSRIRLGDIRIHIAALVATVGFYAVITSYITVMMMNKHIRCQREYEVKILNWMSRSEGASGIIRKRSNEKHGLIDLIQRFT